MNRKHVIKVTYDYLFSDHLIDCITRGRCTRYVVFLYDRLYDLMFCQIKSNFLKSEMRKSQIRSKPQQVSLNSYFQPRSGSKNVPIGAVESNDSMNGTRDSESLMKSTYMKRLSTEEDKNPAVAKKRRQLPSTVVVNKSRNFSPSISPPFPERSEKVVTNRSPPSPMDKSNLENVSQTYHLSYSQKRALDAILQRKSVFYTGAAGTTSSLLSLPSLIVSIVFLF